MIRLIPFLLAFLSLFLVMIEGSISQMMARIPFLPNDWFIVSHFLLLFLIYVTIFFEQKNTYYAFSFAIVLGATVDILYTSLIGVYLFVYATAIYLVRNMMKWLHANFFVAMLMVILGVLIADIFAYFLYSIIQIHDMSWSVYLSYRLLPTLVWNFIFGILFYLLFKKMLEKWAYIKFERKE
ncbi:rod shape-determining protein MreD [Gracilibacillus dipsosauri]|uniref:Rod shape-determining protein MreD n=1 Tax=Gracilibacillus dipsosauri TaxID=178340 RepID=A0A317KZX9_9BACI|nr:rod shape-determining protein MreD [Gracilibacillus dipsosauri]PWU68340.1 rod shape-determining protein MreD [Gracilibacillus dipsosauri]